MTTFRLFVPPLGEYGSPLSPDDYASLERSWISREIADSALIRRVTNEEGKEIVGRRDFADYAGLLFPYLWPGRTGVFAHRIRRDNPPYEIRNGRRKERDKYMSAPGWGNTLYFHPLTPVTSLSDVAIPLVFTEGQKKCLALFRLANEGATETNEHMLFVPVCLNGVYGWGDRREEEKSATGKRVPVSRPIEQLSLIEWARRRVYLLFDTNVHTNAKVAWARNDIAQELSDRGAEVFLIDLSEEDGVNGIDDLLAKHGPGPALKLFEQGRLFDGNERLARLYYTDLGNEQALEIRLYGNDFLYNWTAKQWLHFNGVIWRSDTTGVVDRAMVDVAAARLQAVHKMQEGTAQFGITGDIRFNPKKAIAAALKFAEHALAGECASKCQYEPPVSPAAPKISIRTIICLRAGME